MIGLILWILMGALAGWIASMIMGTDARMGPFANIAVGILGGLVGGFIMTFLGFGDVSGFNLYSLLVSILGAVVVIWLVKLIT